MGVSTDQPDVVIVDSVSPQRIALRDARKRSSSPRPRCDAWMHRLGAVLAHERAHLTGHHHQILMILRSLARALPLLPLLGAAPALSPGCWKCALTTSLSADMVPTHCCAAWSRWWPVHHNRPAPWGQPTSPCWRGQPWLVSPAGPVDQWRERLVLVTAIALTIATPFVAGLLCPS